MYVILSLMSILYLKQRNIVNLVGGLSRMKKVLVVGAGVAGLAVCYWLKKFGFLPTLIEKNNTLRQGGHAVDIFGIAVDVVKKMDIYKKIYDMSTQLEYSYYVDANGNILHKEQVEGSCFGQGDEVEIVRGDLVKILMQSIEGIPCYFNQSIIQIKQHDENIEVTFNDNTIETYDLIIGADGLYSATRSMAFVKDEYNLIDFGSYSSVFSIPNYLKLNRSKTMFELNQKLVSITVGKESSKALVGFMLRSNQMLSNIRDEEEQKDLLKSIFLDFGWETNKLLQFMETCDDFYFGADMQVKMKSWTKRRIALVGDSGYCPSPLSGQGTSVALVGAYILAGELKAAGGNHAVAFERYNALLHPFVEANQDLGAWVNETYLLGDAVSKEAVNTRTGNIIEKISTILNLIKLPEYSAHA